MDVTTLTMDQLKVLAFDLIVMCDQAQQNLNMITVEINRRNSEQKEGEKS